MGKWSLGEIALASGIVAIFVFLGVAAATGAIRPLWLFAPLVTCIFVAVLALASQRTGEVVFDKLTEQANHGAESEEGRPPSEIRLRYVAIVMFVICIVIGLVVGLLLDNLPLTLGAATLMGVADFVLLRLIGWAGRSRPEGPLW